MGYIVSNGAVVETHTPLPAEFFEHSRRVGRDSWEPCLYIKFKAVGSRTVVSRQARESDKIEYPEAWERYQAGEQSPEEGTTPLNVLYKEFKPAFGLELEQRGYGCVELLAALDEPPAEHLEPMWKEAKRYLRFMESSEDA